MRKSNEEFKPLFDPVAERLIISCLLDHGESVMFDIESFCKSEYFYHPENRVIFDTMKHLIVDEKVAKPSLTAILANIDAQTKSEYDLPDYIQAVMIDKIMPQDLKGFCLKVKRLGIARQLRTGLLLAAHGFDSVTGDERVMELIARAEKPVTDISNSIFTQQGDVTDLSAGLDAYLKILAENPNPYRGIPTGFPLWDDSIGGGIRPGGFALVGGRAKAGKSFFGLNVAHNVTGLGIPVLYLDTELTESMMMGRWLARLSGVETRELEVGGFAEYKEKYAFLQEIVKNAGQSHKNFFYINISGKSHHEWLSIIRRWITTKVGFTAEGKTKDCLVIVDYIKMMDSGELKDLKEYQYLGQIATDLHNICVTYNIAMLCLCQLNRDGIGNDDQGAVAGSDRLTQLCSSLTFLRIKDREMDADDMENGDRKLVPICSRFGGGLQDGGYINLFTDLAVAKMEEGRTNHQNRNGDIRLADNNKIGM